MKTAHSRIHLRLGFAASAERVASLSCGPVGGKDPGYATYLRNGTCPLEANTSVWFKFIYFGDESDGMLWIPGADVRGTKFVVCAPSQIAEWWNEAPMGRSGDGDDYSALFAFSSMKAGTYYMRIDDTNPCRVFYQVNLPASSVPLGVPAPSDQSSTQPLTPWTAAERSGINSPTRATRA
jgi:hypothetical protein